MIDTDAAHTVIVGGFNCSPGSRFLNEYVSLADDNVYVPNIVEAESGNLW